MIYNIYPSQGALGEIISVTITGTGFVQGASVDAGDKITVAGVVVTQLPDGDSELHATFAIAQGATLGDRSVSVDGSNTKTFEVVPALQLEGRSYIFVGTDPRFASTNKYFATTAKPPGGILSGTSSNAGDTFTTGSTGGIPWISVKTTTQSTANLDRVLTFKYKVSNVDSSPQVINVTARKFAYATNSGLANICGLGHGYRYSIVYTPYTRPDQTRAEPGIGLGGTSVTETLNPATIACGNKTGPGTLNDNSEFVDNIVVCSSTPIATCSSAHTQVLKVAGFTVRTNSLTITNTSLNYASQGPTQ